MRKIAYEPQDDINDGVQFVDMDNEEGREIDENTTEIIKKPPLVMGIQIMTTTLSYSRCMAPMRTVSLGCRWHIPLIV